MVQLIEFLATVSPSTTRAQRFYSVRRLTFSQVDFLYLFNLDLPAKVILSFLLHSLSVHSSFFLSLSFSAALQLNTNCLLFSPFISFGCQRSSFIMNAAMFSFVQTICISFVPNAQAPAKAPHIDTHTHA